MATTNDPRPASSPILAQLPNLLTLFNLLCGCLAIVCALDNKHLYMVPYLVIAAAIADFSDGFVARALRVASPLGVQLDSLADMVTFGVVPGMVIFQLLHSCYGEHATMALTIPAFLISLFSALRLAKFNIDTRQTDGFLGLPTPSSTLFVVSLIMVLGNDRYGLGGYIMRPVTLYAITVVLSALLVSELPMFALKLKTKNWEANRTPYLFVAYAVALLFTFGGLGIALTIVSYVLLSLVQWAVASKA